MATHSQWASLLLLCAAACAAPPPPEGDDDLRTISTEVDWAPFDLGPGDVVRVTVVGHPEMSSAVDGVVIDPKGKLHLPAVGGVHAVGLDLEGLEAQLVEAFGHYLQRPLVSAELLEAGSRVFHVLGQMSDAGPKILDRPLNALEAMARGGTPVRGADRRAVFLLRPHGDALEVHRFNAKSPGPEGLVQVRPGDVLYVRQSGYDDFQEDILPLLSGFGIPAAILGANLAD